MAYRPLIDFMIVGAQKCGTTALWEYLQAHPQIGMSCPKETHLFSAPDYSVDSSPKEIDRRYAPWFRHCADAEIRGECTPIYMFFPEIASKLKRYNPNLKLIVMVRDPAERAISNYYMQFAKGIEKLPLWLALLAEPLRLWRCANPRKLRSATRAHSYRARGRYSLQLRNLYRHFPAKQVLIVDSNELLHHHQRALIRIFAFLGVATDASMSPRVAMSGQQFGRRKHPVLVRLIRMSFLLEKWRARGLYKL